ncbi:MAG: hypothetical protein WC858_01300 [Parcubacteria group bacterium]|jgi:hypothetical protein
MEKVIEPSIENLLLQLKRMAVRELVTDEAGYEELVDELIADKLEWGELQDDEDNVALREDLIQRWPQVEEYIKRNSTLNP